MGEPVSDHRLSQSVLISLSQWRPLRAISLLSEPLTIIRCPMTSYTHLKRDLPFWNKASSPQGEASVFALNGHTSDGGFEWKFTGPPHSWDFIPPQYIDYSVSKPYFFKAITFFSFCIPFLGYLLIIVYLYHTIFGDFKFFSRSSKYSILVKINVTLA
jgi:hypothetical protein